MIPQRKPYGCLHAPRGCSTSALYGGARAGLCPTNPSRTSSAATDLQAYLASCPRRTTAHHPPTYVHISTVQGPTTPPCHPAHAIAHRLPWPVRLTYSSSHTASKPWPAVMLPCVRPQGDVCAYVDPAGNGRAFAAECSEKHYVVCYTKFNGP